MDYNMKIVIDTNMVIAALVKDSKAREVIMSNKFDFVSLDFMHGIQFNDTTFRSFIIF